MTTITTPEGISTYQCLVIAKALKLYAEHGIKVNRSYSPRNMMRTASMLTGRTYPARGYMKAHDDLMEIVRREQ